MQKPIPVRLTLFITVLSLAALSCQTVLEGFSTPTPTATQPPTETLTLQPSLTSTLTPVPPTATPQPEPSPTLEPVSQAEQIEILDELWAIVDEEYLYEVDRNDTHRMLIDLLVEEKIKSAYAEGEIVKLVDPAMQLRRQADAYAGEGEYQIAIDMLEQSTRQLVRAIRTAGIYIPG